jgi:hypothetical protein
MKPNLETITISKSKYQDFLTAKKSLERWEIEGPILILALLALFLYHFASL